MQKPRGNYEKRATEASKYIMELLASKELATNNVYKAMNDIDDMIVEYTELLWRARTSEKTIRKLKESKS